MKHRTTRIAFAAAAACVLSLGSGSASAQAQKPNTPNLKAIPAAEMKAMDTCVSGVLARLQKEGASYRAVKPAIATDCDGPLRAVLAAAIRVGEAGPCKTVDGCIEMARGKAGDEAALEYQRAALRR